jgi:exoribonuclease R
VSPRTPRDALRNVEVELQRALHDSVHDAQVGDELRRNERDQLRVPSPHHSPRVRAATETIAPTLAALLDALWPNLTDSTSLPVGGGDKEALKSVRDRANSEAVAWLDLDCALRRLKPAPRDSSSRRARVATAPTDVPSFVRHLQSIVVPDAYEEQQQQQQPQPGFRSAYVDLSGVEAVLDSDRSTVVEDEDLPIPPPESTMMRMVQREKELRGDLTTAKTDYRTIPIELSMITTDLAEPTSPRRRQGAVCEAQVRVDANTGHYWAAMRPSNEAETRTPRLVFIPEAHRSVAKRGDWVLLELNAPRADGRQTGKVVQVLANAHGLPVILVPPEQLEQMHKASSESPQLTPVAITLFEAAIDSCLQSINRK